MTFRQTFWSTTFWSFDSFIIIFIKTIECIFIIDFMHLTTAPIKVYKNVNIFDDWRL